MVLISHLCILPCEDQEQAALKVAQNLSRLWAAPNPQKLFKP